MRRKTIALALAVGTLALGAGIAYATIPNDGVIHGCYAKSGGSLRVIDANVTNCKASETSLNWNTQGPTGERGSIGPVGPTGPAGPQGSQGPAGERGATGPAGAVGPQGPQGQPGQRGPTGLQGPQGSTGPSDGYFNAASGPALPPNTQTRVLTTRLPAGQYLLFANVTIVGAGGDHNVICSLLQVGDGGIEVGADVHFQTNVNIASWASISAATDFAFDCTQFGSGTDNAFSPTVTAVRVGALHLAAP